MHLDKFRKVPHFPDSEKNRCIEVQIPFEVQELFEVELPIASSPEDSAVLVNCLQCCFVCCTTHLSMSCIAFAMHDNQNQIEQQKFHPLEEFRSLFCCLS